MVRWYKLEGKTPVQITSREQLEEELKTFDKNKTIGWDKIDDVIISTVFLGLDHSYNSKTPILF